jgi:hypothetical protein
VQSQVKPQVQTQVKPQVQTQVTPQVQTQVKPQVQSQVKPQVQSQIQNIKIPITQQQLNNLSEEEVEKLNKKAINEKITQVKSQVQQPISQDNSKSNLQIRINMLKDNGKIKIIKDDKVFQSNTKSGKYNLNNSTKVQVINKKNIIVD